MEPGRSEFDAGALDSWGYLVEQAAWIREVSYSALLLRPPFGGPLILHVRRVDSRMLDMLHRAQRRDEVSVSLSHPDSLVGLEHVDAPEIGVMGDIRADDVEHLYRLHPRVRDLTFADATWDAAVLLDLERFESVRSLAVSHGQYRPGTHLADCVRRFAVSSAREGSFAALPHGSGVEVLKVSRAPKLDSFAGLSSAYPAIAALDLAALPRLQSLRPGEELAAIRWLALTSCSRLGSIEGVAQMPHLEYLALEDCASIESIAPLTAHPRLERFVATGSTDIADGDLAPLMTMPQLHMVLLRNRRHFSPTAAQIEAQPQLREWDPWDFTPAR